MISESDLRRMYWIECMTQREIGDLVGVSFSTIRNWMNVYGIELRSKSLPKPTSYELERMYYNEGLNQHEIGERFGVSGRTIGVWMNVYGISARVRKPTCDHLGYMYHCEGLCHREMADRIGVSQGSISNWMKECKIEARSQSLDELKPPREILRLMYHGKMLSKPEIAEKLGVSYGTVTRWMNSDEIEIRSISEALSGEKNPSWRGGISYEPYCERFNSVFKKAVRIRDNFVCQLCGLEQDNEELSIHHIHYDKNNCYPDVVSLCRPCHMKVNYNRSYWETHFEKHLSERGLLNWSAVIK